LKKEDKEKQEIVQTAEADTRSVYVKNVEYKCKKYELVEHFKECGNILRITIAKNKFTGHPKGYAYIEFETKEDVENAILLTNSVLCGR